MKETIISFETAKLAKEKGFNEICLYGYNIGEYIKRRKSGYRNNELVSPKDSCVSPTQSLLQKWIRETHSIIIELVYGSLIEMWTYNIFDKNSGKDIMGDFDIEYKQYEEALEVALLKSLQLINK